MKKGLNTTIGDLEDWEKQVSSFPVKKSNKRTYIFNSRQITFFRILKFWETLPI